jgi:hypothetical protein
MPVSNPQIFWPWGISEENQSGWSTGHEEIREKLQRLSQNLITQPVRASMQIPLRSLRNSAFYALKGYLNAESAELRREPQRSKLLGFK